MRALEVVFLAALLLPLASGCLPRRWGPARWLPALAGLALAAAVLHVAVETARWQLVPAYAVAAGVAAAAALRLRTRRPSPRGRVRRAGQVALSLAGVALVAGSAALGAGFPVADLPAPTGPYAVGRTELHLVDGARREVYGPAPGGPRELMVTAWYPADAGAGARFEPYVERGDPVGGCTAELAAAFGGLPGGSVAYSHWPLIASHSVPNAPVAAAAAPLPVLVFSHGYAVARARSYRVLLEELASHGYAVFAIDHTYETPGVLFPDGRVACGDVDQIRRLSGAGGGGEVQAWFERWGGELSDAERDAMVRRFAELNPATGEGLAVWSADTAAVVDELERRARRRDDPLFAQLDVSRVGVFGMSFGGANAGMFCVDDPRCAAGLNLDGFQYGPLQDRALEVPFLLMSAVRPAPDLNRWVYLSRGAPFYYVDIEGSTHMNFADASVLLPGLRRLGMLGSIDGLRMLEIVNRYALAFFDVHLRGRTSSLLAGPAAEFPEVSFERAPESMGADAG